MEKNSSFFFRKTMYWNVGVHNFFLISMVACASLEYDFVDGSP